MELNHRTILVTGGTSGIGFALARQFVEDRNRVIICGRDRSRLDRAQARLAAVQTILCDINNPHDLTRLVSQVSSRYPGLDTLVNNAGVQRPMDLTAGQLTEREIFDEINTNLSAQINVTRCLYPILRANRNPACIFTGSALGLVPKYEVPVYSAAKAGLHSFVQSFRDQSKRDGFRVFEIFPEVVRTPMTAHRSGESMMEADEFADRVVRQLKSGRPEIFVGKARLLNLIGRLAPKLAQRIVNGDR